MNNSNLKEQSKNPDLDMPNLGHYLIVLLSTLFILTMLNLIIPFTQETPVNLEFDIVIVMMAGFVSGFVFLKKNRRHLSPKESIKLCLYVLPILAINISFFDISKILNLEGFNSVQSLLDPYVAKHIAIRLFYLIAINCLGLLIGMQWAELIKPKKLHK